VPEWTGLETKMEQHVEFVKNVARTRFAAEAELEPMALI
jgi:hypothetical protein